MQAISTFAHGSTYNPRKFQLKLIIWIARCSHPFAIVDDPEFIDLLRTLNSRVSIPSCSTVSRDVLEVFKISQGNVAAVLKVIFPNCRGRITERILTGIPGEVALLY